MKVQELVGALVGGFVGLAANVVIGFIFGLGLGIYMDRTYSGPPVESAMMLAFIFPGVLITTGRPFAGAIVGLLSSRLKSIRAIILATLTVGLAHGSLCAVLTGGNIVLRVWLDYTCLAVVSASISGLTVYRVLSR